MYILPNSRFSVYDLQWYAANSCHRTAVHDIHVFIVAELEERVDNVFQQIDAAIERCKSRVL